MLGNALKAGELIHILPEIALTIAATVLLLMAFGEETEGRAKKLGWFSVVAVLVALLLTQPMWGNFDGGQVLNRMVVSDAFSLYFKVILLGIALLVALLAMEYVGKHRIMAAEFFSLLLFAVVGTTLIAASLDILMIYLALELMSIPSYILAGTRRTDPKSNEASIKYFLMGAMASAIILFGMSLLFGLTGSTNLVDIASLLTVDTFVNMPALMAAALFLVAGFGFKIAAVPFHMWAPDAYEGAPTPVTAFFSAGPKVAAFAAVLRVFMVGFGGVGLQMELTWILAILAVITMTVGNLTALQQTNIKRMLAYSSISHVGYALVGLVVGTLQGIEATVYYLLAYVFVNLGAFAVVIMLNNAGMGSEIEDFKGLSKRSPWAAVALTVFFLSLIGIPPAAGFFAKFFIFSAAVQSGWIWLALVVVVNSAISVGYYYGSVVRTMWLVEPEVETPVTAGFSVNLVMVMSMIATFGLAIFLEPFIHAVTTVATQL